MHRDGYRIERWGRFEPHYVVFNTNTGEAIQNTSLAWALYVYAAAGPCSRSRVVINAVAEGQRRRYQEGSIA